VNGSISKLRARADVSLALGGDGVIKICGFSIFQHDENQLPHVSPPARAGNGKWYDTVMLVGRIHKLVVEAVLEEYEHQKQKTNGGKAK